MHTESLILNSESVGILSAVPVRHYSSTLIKRVSTAYMYTIMHRTHMYSYGIPIRVRDIILSHTRMGYWFNLAILERLHYS